MADPAQYRLFDDVQKVRIRAGTMVRARCCALVHPQHAGFGKNCRANMECWRGVPAKIALKRPPVNGLSGCDKVI
jgi:hypothetical protein